jgi:hypothetical protein
MLPEMPWRDGANCRGKSMDQKKCLFVFFSLVVLMIVVSTVGGVLISKGALTKEVIGAPLFTLLFIIYIVLLFIMFFPLAPVIIRFFINAQIGLGNSDLPLIKWMMNNEKKVTFYIWAFYLIILSVALPVIV